MFCWLLFKVFCGVCGVCFSLPYWICEIRVFVKSLGVLGWCGLWVFVGFVVVYGWNKGFKRVFGRSTKLGRIKLVTLSA